MKYSNGDPILIGDKVGLGGGMTGVVVAIIDKNEFSDNYLVAEWNYLSEGVLVESPEAGLIHYTDVDHDFNLIARRD